MFIISSRVILRDDDHINSDIQLLSLKHNFTY